ncbi:MAG TPA: extracellular solute-binding protein [Polyangiaceae bacterium LLY-WYZ-15_(1-7)]|nr:sugar ABC transporter permease [Myxococcales bacterium]MAT28294.1 sugar ABC transporter permease [Sandaracinus sp.]HJK95018.1 extracellular solute-binding protein [Polyangiaceae bacterium LLY-WYZ-15_(1-7)]HJL05800.1 extracellular solute-binding protein [Polyangiaceae bacterium LLY-WYZ-15_(1-7)]HJL09896.1 extracellular solute-binding protein [Polyangiaceae bacterium LLY-WYZ-15_(1-7)]
MRRAGGGVRGSVLALAALALALLAAATPAPAAAQETLTLWHAYGGAEEEAIREVARAYEEAHPGTRVELLAVAFGAYAAKLESAIPTGRGPDVFIDAHERLASYLERDLVLPLEGADVADLEPRHLEALRSEGTLYGLPLSAKCAALYVNTDRLSPPLETLEDAFACCDEEGASPLVFEAENGYYAAAFVHAFGGQMLSAEGEYAFIGDEAREAVALLDRWLDEGRVPEEANGELVKRLFASGRAGAAISGPWLAPDLPEDLAWTVQPLPTLAAAGEPLAPYATIEAAYVATNGEAPEAAKELAAFVAGPEAARIRATVGRQVVSSRSAWEDPALAEDDFLRTFRDAARQATPMPTHPNMRLVFEPAQRALRKVLRAGEPVEESLAAGARSFADVTRPLPEPASPTPLLAFLGLLLLAVVGSWAYKLRDPQTRAALKASLPAYKYLAHAFVAVGLLVILPLLVGAATSLFAGRGTDLYYVGTANYADILTARGGELFGHGSFYVVLLVTVLWTVLNLAFHVGIGVALALILNRKNLRFKGPYRVLLILPWAVPNYVTALAWKGMFHRQFGAINGILEALGAEPVSWFAQWSTAFAANVTTNVWLGFPFMMVITLGALTSIPKDLYEAAAVDGATPWQRFRHVTWPMLGPALAPAVAMGAVWTFNMFNVVFLVSAGEPDGTTEILVSEAYRWAFTRGSQYGYAAAYAVLIFGILVVTTRLFGRGLTESKA